jgi:hypothetical protein
VIFRTNALKAFSVRSVSLDIVVVNFVLHSFSHCLWLYTECKVLSSVFQTYLSLHYFFFTVRFIWLLNAFVLRNNRICQTKIGHKSYLLYWNRKTYRSEEIRWDPITVGYVGLLLQSCTSNGLIFYYQQMSSFMQFQYKNINGNIFYRSVLSLVTLLKECVQNFV